MRWWLAVGLVTAVVAAEPPSYNRDVRPILSDNCFLCHGPDKAGNKADLRLDAAEHSHGAVAESGRRVLVPGDAETSEMWHRILSDDPDEIMPPPESHLSLTAGEKDILRRWIEAGAEYEPHWAFVPVPAEVPVPAVRDAEWPRSPIDRFILARLEAEGLQPSPPAPRERWLRRVTYDLTGLPPTHAEFDEFLADESEDAFERVVDRLLASPRYGERMAVPWLDLARYADSFGYQADVKTDAWPYRDWVIDAFNRNLPIDEFIIEQLAGDLLPGATRDQKLATAFNRIHRKTNEGGSVPEEFRQDGISDRVHTVGTAFLGLTMECARCHDHKYDPVSMRDYYSLGAFFNSIDEFGLVQGGSNKGIVLPQPALRLPTPEQEEQLARLRGEVEKARAAYDGYLASTEAESAFEAWDRAEYPRPGFVGHFSFDGDAVGGNSRDPGKDAKIGGNTRGPGAAGQGVTTNGDDAVSVPPFGIAHSEQPLTISLWLKPGEDYPRAVVFANTSSFDANYSGYELLLEEGRLRWSLMREFPGCAASVATTGTVPTGEWTHVTVTNDGSQKAAGLKIFVNGRPAETTVVKDTLTRDYHIGGGLNFAARGRDFGLRGGAVDEITVHRRALTALEIRALHAGSELGEVDATDPERREYFLSAVDPRARELAAALDAARTALRSADDQVGEIVTMREIEPVPHFILERGDYTMPGERVDRETPDWLPPFPADQPRNRLGFARWLTMPDHPLTARVTINRLWQEIFGRGIVVTSDNFGLQGALPTHPQLLDWLARDFIRHGWDQKRAIRQMVLSATYRQDSRLRPELAERDPENELLARGPARRLTAEMIRDSALELSGLLVEKIGGPPVKPYQAPGSMWKTLNNFLPQYVPDKGEGLYRRSLYTFWRRTTTPPNMMVFDTPSRDVCTTRRMPTNTPLQPLVTLNDPQHVEAARKFAERILREGGANDAERVAWAWREVTSRSADPQRVEILSDLLEEQREFFRGGSSEAAKLLKVGESPADPALDPVELAAHAALAQALLNLDAHLTLR